MHACPIKVCDEPVPDTHLTCRGHWWMVPEQLRTAVWQAYHRWERDKKNIPALRALRAAQQAAIAAVEAKLAATQQPRETTS